MKRRRFLSWGLGGMLLGRAAAVGARAWVPDFSAIRVEATGMNAGQWVLLAAVQNHLFPSEPGAPGARDVSATAWLQWVLSDPDVENNQREFFRQGAERLAKLSLDRYGKAFMALGGEDRETLLREYEHLPGGQRWLREVLYYVLEALLTDPVYGGNPREIGWKWLGHKPGYKRPPANKRYFLL